MLSDVRCVPDQWLPGLCSPAVMLAVRLFGCTHYTLPSPTAPLFGFTARKRAVWRCDRQSTRESTRASSSPRPVLNAQCGRV
mgnify:CR=1 FL=1